MKKALFTTMLIMLFAGSAFAQATFSLTGSYWAEGKYWFNYNATPDVKANYNDTSFGFYEQDINLFPKITVGNTSLNFKVAITDVYWASPGTDGTEGVTKAAPDKNANDDNIEIERAFITHKLTDKLTLDVGLMDGTAWGTSFADDKQGQWRVKLSGMTSVGLVGAVLEKNIEAGAAAKDAQGEGGDRDSYGLYAISKVGNIYIKPLLWYVDSMNSGTGWTLFNPQIAFNGDLGGVSFETEINYKMWNTQDKAINFDEDATTLGIYLNVWKALDAMTPGFIFAYGSYDDDAADKGAPASQVAFDFCDDFDSTVILGDEYGWGGGGDLRGMTLLKAYVNDIKTPIAPLTLSGYAAYVMSNQKDTAYEDATAFEIGVGGAYKLTDNLVYSAYVSYADISYDFTDIDDPDSVYVVANAIQFNF